SSVGRCNGEWPQGRRRSAAAHTRWFVASGQHSECRSCERTGGTICKKVVEQSRDTEFAKRSSLSSGGNRSAEVRNRRLVAQAVTALRHAAEEYRLAEGRVRRTG